MKNSFEPLLQQSIQKRHKQMHELHSSRLRWTPLPHNHLQKPNEQSLQIGMEMNQELVFMGSIQIQVLKGMIEVFGKRLTVFDSFIPVYSSNTKALLTIHSPLSMTNEVLQKSSIYEKYENEVKEMGPVVLLIKQLNHSFNFDQIIPSFNPFLPNNFDLYQPLLDGFYVQLTEDAQFPSLILSYDWFHTAQTLINSTTVPTIITIGNRNTGKSSFNRYLINSLLNKYPSVCLLDSDLGQSEMTPSGFVSLALLQQPLLGPPFTHLFRPNMRQYFIGHNNTNANPRLFIEGVYALIQYYKQNYSSVPLVVNTQGWITGLGLSLLYTIIQYLQPQYWVKMGDCQVESTGIQWNSKGLPQSVQEIPLDSYQPTVFNLPSFAKNKTGVDSKLLTMAQYFQIGPNNAITQQKPIFLSFDNCTIHLLDSMVDPKYILDTLNGQLIGFVVDERPQSQKRKGFPKLLRKRPFYFPNDESITFSSMHGQCLGLGIIRSIIPPPSTQSGLFIVTPVPLEVLSQYSLCLVKGSIQVPQCMIYQDESVEEGPYGDSVQMEGGLGNQVRRVRRNLQRAGAVVYQSQ